MINACEVLYHLPGAREIATAGLGPQNLPTLRDEETESIVWPYLSEKWLLGMTMLFNRILR